MDQLFEVFFSAQMLMLCLGIYAMTYVIRRVLETVWPKIRTNRYYAEIALPIGPIANGTILGFFMKAFEWPAMVGTSAGGLMLFGSVCGMLSALVYGRVRSWLKSKPVPGLPSDPPSIPPPVLDSLPPADEPKAGD